jgi:hypothetical protein
MKSNGKFCRRKEQRFKTRDTDALRCETTVKDEAPRQGTVIDLSPSGLRFLCAGKFQAGQTFSTELISDHSHGTFRGEIRRVEPWTGGQSVLGCQLLDQIPEDVLQDLAREGIVNRRRDPRVDWNQPAKLSWELHQGEIDVEINDCAPGGLKISSDQEFPSDVRVRISIDLEGEQPVLIDARTVWQAQQQNLYVAGVAFTDKGTPDAILPILGQAAMQRVAEVKAASATRRTLVAMTVIIVSAISLWQIGTMAH